VAPTASRSALAKPAEQKLAAPAPSPVARPSALAKPASKLAAPKAAAAAAGVGSGWTLSSPEAPTIDSSSVDSSNQFVDAGAPATIETPEIPEAQMSSAVADEPQIETFEPQAAEDGPKLAVDPMMAEGGSNSSSGVSFSEMTELPPLKEVYIPPPPPPTPLQPVQSAIPAATRYQGGRKADEKPKVQPREVAEKAMKEIKSVPPKLMFYAIGGAAALILVIGIGVTIYIHSLNSDSDPDAGRPAAVADTPAPEVSQPEPKQTPAPVQSTPQPVETQPAETAQPETTVAEPVASSRGRNSRKKAAAPVVIPGQLAIDSTPQGAQVQVDGRTDPS